LHGPDAKQDLNFCGQCHAVPFGDGPGSNPRFTAPVGDLDKGCEDCHDAKTAHPVPWLGTAATSHKTAGNLAVACALCHGATLQGFAEGGAGPACVSCHTAGSPLELLDCSSCHNDPPDDKAPSGANPPNREGGHSEHNELPKVTGACIACHNGSGTNTLNHFDVSASADVSIVSSYDAKTGTGEYDSGGESCSNVSCHGGQQTPNWLEGGLDVNTDCASCHELGIGQFNSYNSGKHEIHVVTEAIACTTCHDTTKLATNHFVGLDTPAFEGNPAETIGDAVKYDLSTCAAGALGNCHGRAQGSWE
jgi:predicted CxxxxCH...CXXCH cytochrome family protein